MRNIESFLQLLTNVELAFLYKYKYPGYFDSGRACVDAEISKRNLSLLNLEQLVGQGRPNSQNGCPRCGSNKQYNIPEEKLNRSSVASLDGLVGRVEMTTRDECAVCGYLIYDGNEPTLRWPFWKKALDYILHLFGSAG